MSPDLPPPPTPNLRIRLRRLWRGRGQTTPTRYWLTYSGAPLLLVCAGLYVANGCVIGWRTAYDVAVHITSPADTAVPGLAWVLSVVGWLVVPALVGAVAGHVISSAIVGRRSKPLDEVFNED